MPELPEVETVKRGLAPQITGRRLVRVITRRTDLRLPLPDGFGQRIEGCRVERLARRAKYLLFYLDNDDVLICHLGMSGRLTIRPVTTLSTPHNITGEIFAKHDHVIFETDQGDLLIYNDPRRFGLMALCPAGRLDQQAFFAGMGPEPLGNGFSGPYLREKLAHRRGPIKTVLLDQRVVVGLGNIYACEALFLAEIAPERPAHSLMDREVEKIIPAIRDVLTRAIASGGSSLKDYAQPDGNLGYFQHDFTVYGQEGRKCTNKTCSGTIARITQAGRSTFYCPVCQN